MRIFPTSTFLFQPVRLSFWAMISILGKNSNTWTNKIGIIRLYFGSIFPPVRLFQPVCLLILTKFPTSTFIHTSTFIWDFRVLSILLRSKNGNFTMKIGQISFKIVEFSTNCWILNNSQVHLDIDYLRASCYIIFLWILHNFCPFHQ